VGVHLEWPLIPSYAAGRNAQLAALTRHLNARDDDELQVLLGDFNHGSLSIKADFSVRDTE